MHSAVLSRSIASYCFLTASLAISLGCSDSIEPQNQPFVMVHQAANFSSQSCGSIHNQVLSSEFMRNLCTNNSLSDLSFVHSERAELNVFSELGKLEQLESLTFIEVELGDEELKQIAELKSLRCLQLARTGIDGCGLKYLSGLPLKRLAITEPSLTRESLQEIVRLPELEELHLHVTNLNVSDIPSLADLSKLRSVSITSGHFSYREFGGLKCLLGAKSLRNLELSGPNLNDRSLKVISTLPNLETLSIGEHKVSPNGLLHFEHLRSCRVGQNIAIQDSAMTDWSFIVAETGSFYPTKDAVKFVGF